MKLFKKPSGSSEDIVLRIKENADGNAALQAAWEIAEKADNIAPYFSQIAQGLSERGIVLEGEESAIMETCKLILEQVEAISWVQRPRQEPLFKIHLVGGRNEEE